MAEAMHGDANPVVVIGAGPVGLAAAAHLHERGLPFLVLEAGAVAGASVREWRHVRLFSPWRYNVDPAARRLLEGSGWAPPDPRALPTGGDLVEEYLEPLAGHPAVAPRVRYGARVAAITRVGTDLSRTAGREAAPFVVRLASGEDVLARAVVDASGTWRTPNVLGANGLPAHGETGAAAWVERALPDVLGADRHRFAGRHTVVVGAGHSAATSLLALATLADEAPGTRLSWAIRGEDPTRAYGGQDQDQLPARGALGAGLRGLVDTGHLTLESGFRVAAVRPNDAGGVDLAAERSAGGERTVSADRVVAATGYRPDHSIADELRLDLDPALRAPTALAPLIDPNTHTCGTVYPHGIDELSHPEPGYFAVGAKSYGRAPTFLMATGYEQARSVVAALAGDWDTAREVHLELPETGVCSAVQGSQALADHLGVSRQIHTDLLAATNRHLPASESVGDAVLAAAAELDIAGTAAFQLAAHAADQAGEPTPLPRTPTTAHT